MINTYYMYILYRHFIILLKTNERRNSFIELNKKKILIKNYINFQHNFNIFSQL